MKRGKHSAKGVYKKKKLRWDRIIGLFFIIAVVFLGVNQIKSVKANQDENAKIVEKQSSEQEAVAVSIGEVEEVLQEKEDEKIKVLIQGVEEENNLNESNFSFFYYNVNQKTYYFYNQDTYFTAASTIKMPIAMAYYDEVNAGNMKLDDTLTYKEGCYAVGGGITDYTYNVGEQVPLQFLIKEAIINSDNTATNILLENWGYKECKYQIAKYSEVELPENFYSENITSAKYGYDVVSYLYEHQQEYAELIGYLKQSSGGQYLKKYIEQYEVAHKYGSYNGYVHDYGIVYSENPYLIGIFTKNVASADELIAQISLQVLEKNMEK